MTKESVFIIIAEIYIVYWFLCLAYSRHKAAMAKAAEKAKYGRWDDAYAKALKEDKGHEYAVAVAIKAVNANPAIVLAAWKDAYTKAIANGLRKYSAGIKASTAAREIAHRR